MKKLVVMILSLVFLATTLAACGTKSNNETNADTTKTEPSEESTEDTTGDDAVGSEISEPVTLKMYFHGSDVTDDSAVMGKVNEYLGEKLNVTLEPIWGTWNDFDDGATLALNGGDKIDIYFTCSWSANEYISYARKGAWVRLDDSENNLIEKYASDLWAVLPDVLIEGATIDGSDGVGVYAVPGYKDIATQNCWDINVPLLEKYGYTVDDIKNADYYAFGDIMKTVKEGEGDSFYPLLVEGAVLERMVNNSIVVTGDAATNNLMSYYINRENPAAEGTYGNTIMNKFETDEYKKFVEQTREYYRAGYIDPAMGNRDQANDTRTAKQPCTPAHVETTSSQGALMAISTASDNPERAMMLLNLLNTDAYLMTLLNYGMGGVHYDMVDGEAVFTEERSHYMSWTNGMGNVTLLPPQEGQGVDFWDTFKAYYGEASEIPLLGYAFNATSVETELGALVNIAEGYALALSTGTIDPAEKLPEFLQKLEDNGIDKIVDEANSQLTDFLNEKEN